MIFPVSLIKLYLWALRLCSRRPEGLSLDLCGPPWNLEEASLEF